MELFPDTAEVRRVSLVKLSGEIARSMATIGRIAVDGEIVKPHLLRGGGAFFSLRDRAAQMTVRVASSRMARCRIVHGERVRVTATLEFATDRGELRLVAEEVVPVGEGAIAALLAEVRASLEADGLLDRPRRPIPRLPRRIAVVCGTDAAVRADIESVVVARYEGYPVEFVETSVSGPGAVDAVITALGQLDERDDVDVIVLARGGGDPSQLLPFSDEALCRAVAACTTPVVSAIGHDGDRPLCDLVADLRCGTPSLAAAAVVPDHAALVVALDALVERAVSAFRHRTDIAARRLAANDPEGALRSGLDTAAHRVDRAGQRLALVHPARALDAAISRLRRTDWHTPVVHRQLRCQAELAGHRRHLDALSPARVLERGYAVVRAAGGPVVRDASTLAAGDALELTFARGRAAAIVTSSNGEPPRESPPS